MSHELATVNNKVAMAYVGDTPWHGLGSKLEANATLDQWAEASGLNYKLNLAPVEFGEVKMPNSKIVYREDNNQGLGIVSNKYHLVQPIEVLEFFKKYVGSVAQIETAGVLFEGRKYWAMAKLEGGFDVAGDRTDPYVLLSSSCDGSSSTQARLTSVRTVCANTLAIATSTRADVSIRHNVAYDAEIIHGRMELLQTRLLAHAETMKTLASIKMSDAKAQEFIANIFNTDKLNAKGSRIYALYNGEGKGADLESAKGTAYGLLQSFTQWQDWEAGKTQDSRVYSAWFGPGVGFKTSVVDKLLELA